MRLEQDGRAVTAAARAVGLASVPLSLGPDFQRLPFVQDRAERARLAVWHRGRQPNMAAKAKMAASSGPKARGSSLARARRPSSRSSTGSSE